jgi:hypothetical protein
MHSADTDVSANERDHVVDRIDALARDFSVEELGFFFVNGGGRQPNQNLSVNLGREFHTKEVNALNDGRPVTRRFAGVYVKHQFLRLAPPEPE